MINILFQNIFPFFPVVNMSDELMIFSEKLIRSHKINQLIYLSLLRNLYILKTILVFNWLIIFILRFLKYLILNNLFFKVIHKLFLLFWLWITNVCKAFSFKFKINLFQIFYFGFYLIRLRTNLFNLWLFKIIFLIYVLFIKLSLKYELRSRFGL